MESASADESSCAALVPGGASTDRDEWHLWIDAGGKRWTVTTLGASRSLPSFAEPRRLYFLAAWSLPQ
jgi:hypothetical protein